MAIEDYILPMQSLTSKAAINPNANIMGLATSPFAVNQGQGQSQAALMGLSGLADQYAGLQDQRAQEQPVNSFQSQTPIAPQMPGRIDQTALGGQDPLALLDANINRRFGIV